MTKEKIDQLKSAIAFLHQASGQAALQKSEHIKCDQAYELIKKHLSEVVLEAAKLEVVEDV